ncbi:ATP-NAD kinase-like domain-containing protein [Vararia minispora EC-137]|uniref:ATP-NAD kinase-like domain-containing protein n=1 Tax=Vararia minispora EC-137 TaxID=1314806 RepID=A0ACB8QCM5_9AGAM|nr:ATP-NAD kinase-like domain-containing protein [Vararia minispora EC-137]
MSLLLVYNPVCGSSSGREIAEQEVLPLLAKHGIVPAQVAGTQYAGHAGILVLEFLEKMSPHSDHTIILVSGDGTLHEIINALHERKSSEIPVCTIKLVLVPGGTANALHSSLFPPSPGSETTLSAVHAYLSSSSSLKPLAIAKTIIQAADDSSSTGGRTSILSAVVTSTSLHACILHDAEALRATVPGLDRFKLAAAQNATRWYNAHLRLLPSTRVQSSPVLQYDALLGRFVAAPNADTPVELAGPFAYMLSTVNVDRLEPTFRITPLQRTYPPSPPTTMDVVIVRPQRDPSLSGTGDAQRELFKDKVWAVMGGAYQDGVHIAFAYGAEGKVEPASKGQPVVEYFRVGGWEWIPGDDDERAYLVCADGAILTIPTGGKAVSRVLEGQELGFNISVYSL